MWLYWVLVCAFFGVLVLIAAATRNYTDEKVVILKAKDGRYVLCIGDPDEEGQAWAVFLEEEFEG